MVLGLITTRLLTGNLGVKLYGDYVFLTAFWLFLVNLSDWGTPFVGVREISRQRNNSKKSLVFTNLVYLRRYLLLGTLLIGLILIAALSAFTNLRLLAALSLLALIFTSFQINLTTLFQAFFRFDWQTLMEISNNGFFLLFLYFSFSSTSFFWPKGLAGVILALVLARLLSFFLALFKSKKLPVIFSQKSKQTILFLGKEALPTGGLLFLSTAYDRLVDTLFLKNFWGSGAVGVYGLSYKLYSNLILPAYFFSRTLFPFLSQGKKKEKTQAVFKLGITWSLLGSFLIIGLGWGFSFPLISFLGGEPYLEAVTFLRILLLSLPFTYLNHIFGFSLIAQNKQFLSFKIGLFSLLWNLILNWWAIPRFASLGAAWVTVSTEILVCLLSFLVLKKTKATWYTRTDERNRPN